jgi:ketosteroid isomerase-like protein
MNASAIEGNEEPRTGAVIERLESATNAHDVEAIVACFSEGYTLEAPLHAARSFRGREQVRRNWSQILSAVPDLRATVIASAVDGATIWTEWEMAGTRRDGARHLMRGVFVFVVGGGQIRAGRMFFEPVDRDGGDMDAAVRAELGPR